MPKLRSKVKRLTNRLKSILLEPGKLGVRNTRPRKLGSG